jgi:hypothetical protein
MTRQDLTPLEAALAKLERRLSLRLYVGGVVLALLIIGERFVK